MTVDDNAANAPGSFPRRVLIVDDDPLLCEVLRRFFESQGATKVDTAGNGSDALDLIAAAHNPYDLTTLDLSMPDVDGFEFLNHLKQHSVEMRILIISSLPATVIRMAETLADFETLNAIGHLRKPVSASALGAILKGQCWNMNEEETLHRVSA